MQENGGLPRSHSRVNIQYFALPTCIDHSIHYSAVERGVYPLFMDLQTQESRWGGNVNIGKRDVIISTGC